MQLLYRLSTNAQVPTQSLDNEVSKRWPTTALDQHIRLMAYPGLGRRMHLSLFKILHELQTMYKERNKS